MRSPIERLAPLLAILAVASLASAATFTPAVTPTSETSPAALPSPAASAQSSPTFAPSPPPPTPRRTPRSSASPEAAANVDPTPVEIPDVQGDEASIGEMPSPQALPTSPPVGAVRAFRTPEREAEPAFVAPRIELPADTDGTQPGEPAPTMPPPDRPYIATITFRAVASTEIDGFDLVIIYPRSAGNFVGSGAGVDCRKTGDATLFVDDHEDGMLRLLVASSRALTFPFDVVCRFTVSPNATLPARLIAVNVADVTMGSEHGDPSALTVSVIAR